MRINGLRESENDLREPMSNFRKAKDDFNLTKRNSKNKLKKKKKHFEIQET